MMYEIEMTNGDLLELSDNELKKRLNELCEYRRLEREGLLLRLPCKVGDTVYFVHRYSREVEEISFSAFWLRDIGKTVFLTREEAEAKLKELEG